MVKDGMLEMISIGIDIGSTAAKAAVVEDGNIVATVVEPTGFNSVDAANRLAARLESMGYSVEENPVVATGYGRVSVPFAAKTVTEITCHGLGAVHLFGADGVVIDIGGQDTKVIHLTGGRVKKFTMNDKCAAGTGKFLEVMADRMGVTQDTMGEMARSGKLVSISSMCTVFAESEVISLIGKGEPRENIANGVVESVVGRVCSLAGSALGSLPDGAACYLTGGLCENGYVIERLEANLKRPVVTCPEARYAGAIGAAICAAK